jgi:hypothetical protein
MILNALKVIKKKKEKKVSKKFGLQHRRSSKAKGMWVVILKIRNS